MTGPSRHSIDFVRQWLAEVRGRVLSAEEDVYLKSSSKRYALVLDEIEDAIQTINLGSAKGLTFLDVGPHFFTTLVRARFPELTINTLGFENHRLCPPGVFTKHFPYDLNDAHYRDRWPRFDEHDIIVAGEVIEHLYTAPSEVLVFLGSLLKPGGHLIITTPNAAAITNRLNLLAGRNPYEMIRLTRENPGHFREYTQAELTAEGRAAGLEVVKGERRNYFVRQTRAGTIIFTVTDVIPSFRDGLVFVYARPREPRVKPRI